MYDEIKHIGESEGITLIKGGDFDEDNIMRYYFVSYTDDNYDATAPYILKYLKKQLAYFRNNDRSNGYKNMMSFINNYIDTLHSFFAL